MMKYSWQWDNQIWSYTKKITILSTYNWLGYKIIYEANDQTVKINSKETQSKKIDMPVANGSVY